MISNYRLRNKGTLLLKIKQSILIFPLLFIFIISHGQNRYPSELTKKVVFARDGGICQCCGSFSNLEFDHIKPYSCGGKPEISNIQLLCQKCNRSKSNSCYCKIHNNKVGVDCCAKSKKLPSTQSQSSKQCIAKTKMGVRCRNKTKNLNQRCHHHQK